MTHLPLFVHGTRLQATGCARTDLIVVKSSVLASQIPVTCVSVRHDNHLSHSQSCLCNCSFPQSIFKGYFEHLKGMRSIQMTLELLL